MTSWHQRVPFSFILVIILRTIPIILLLILVITSVCRSGILGLSKYCRIMLSELASVSNILFVHEGFTIYGHKCSNHNHYILQHKHQFSRTKSNSPVSENDIVLNGPRWPFYFSEILDLHKLQAHWSIYQVSEVLD